MDEWNPYDFMAAIRDTFATGGWRDRETAIRDVAALLGFQRVSQKTRTAIHTALTTAVRRGILVNDGGGLRLDCATIDDYPTDLLVESLLAAVGRTWCDREDAIYATAYRLGFRRVGPKIRQRLKTTIATALRRGGLETDGPNLRRQKLA